MDDLDQSLARRLGVVDVGPVEFPEPMRPPRAPSTTRAQWAGLGAFAIVGATSILVLSGVGDAPIADVEAAVKEKPILELPALEPEKPPVYAVSVDGAPALGTSDAMVTLVVATDYSCADCDEARGMLETLRGSYGRDLRIVFKPNPGTPDAVPSSVGACAAAMQGELERFDRAIRRLGASRGDRVARANEKNTQRAARELGLDMRRFGVDWKRCAAIVATSARELGKLGIHARGYFVNGRLVDPWGLDTIGTFQTLIDEELAKARRRIAAGTKQERYYREWVLDIGHSWR